MCSAALCGNREKSSRPPRFGGRLLPVILRLSGAERSVRTVPANLPSAAQRAAGKSRPFGQRAAQIDMQTGFLVLPHDLLCRQAPVQAIWRREGGESRCAMEEWRLRNDAPAYSEAASASIKFPV